MFLLLTPPHPTPHPPRPTPPGLLAAEREAFTPQLNDLKGEARGREKKLHMENRRLADERVSEEGSFKEILGQQEEEYEDELRQLIAAAENELVNERETITKLRTLVQMKNTKVDQLKKKLLELSHIFKARQGILDQERREKEKLMETIVHYKKNLQEREDALAEKEKIILELRSTTRTLENFRFVLDHRLQQLGAERDPIRAHIEGLESHISVMYEELVGEFETKKSTSDVLFKKEQKISMLLQELTALKQDVASKDLLVAGFQRELGNIATSAVAGKELEESVRMMYKKFVLGMAGKGGLGAGQGSRHVMSIGTAKAVGDLVKSKEEKEVELEGKVGKVEGSKSGLSSGQVKDIEEALVENAKEAERQRKFLEKESTGLRHRLTTNKSDVERAARARLRENSSLLYECNDLRREVKQLERQLDVQGGERQDLMRTIEHLKGQLQGAVTGGVGGYEEDYEDGGRRGSRPDTAATHLTSAPGRLVGDGVIDRLLDVSADY